ncbi:MAG: choice-of-anchor D domain-containing protein, partial [Acidobacteriota bacterium]|nr:choice-of-anchor D domain-containing protein [Acidobacteriota bacterium]
VNALLNGPADIALDPAGNLFIADSNNGRVRRVDAVTGVIMTVAGGGTSSGSDGLGDGGQAINARLDSPEGIALDSAGNLYIADTGDSRVREVNLASGLISVVAGNGFSGNTGDLGPAVNASLGSPSAVRVDTAGNIYVADQANSVIRQINSVTGFISKIAGTGAHNYSGDGGSPLTATLAGPSGLALDAAGNVYIADYSNNAVREISVTGAPMSFPTTFVGQAGALPPLWILNVGNQPLKFSGLTVPYYFAQQSLDTADCAATSVVPVSSSCPIAIQFVPTRAGVVSGDLLLTTNAENNSSTTQAVVLSGTGAVGAVPQVTLSSTTLAFGNQAVGTASATKTVTITNTGSAPLSLNGISVSGPNTGEFPFTFTCPFSIAPGANCSIPVAFAPIGSGPRSASLTVPSTTGLQTIVFTGAGLGTPQVSVSPGVIQFGSRSIGGTAAVQTITLSNTGSGNLTLTGVVVSGAGSSDFVETKTCGATLAPNANCTISISFSPHVAGLRTANLTITDNASASTQTLLCTGSGVVRSSPAVWRPSNGTWYFSGAGNIKTKSWGAQGDVPVPGDYDGDGKTDFAVFRPANGTWYIIPSRTSIPYTKQWGAAGDIPVPRDYDGDGKTDIAVYRPASGSWFVFPSNGSTPYGKQWGIQGDVPVPGDYDGDGHADIAIYRPSSGYWFIVPSSGAPPISIQWGSGNDIAIAADYDGDGKTDVAVWRPSNGTWYVIPSSTAKPYSAQWGAPGDVPVQGDFDGDGKADVALWRPSTGIWYIFPSSGAAPYSSADGIHGDLPSAGNY